MDLIALSSVLIAVRCIDPPEWFRAGSQASPQDRFLVMAAEMDNNGSQDLAQFWKEVQKAKVMEHRWASARLIRRVMKELVRSR